MSTVLRPAGDAEMDRTRATESPAGGAVAFYFPSLCGGGAERVMVNLAEGMAERGLPVDMVVAAAEGELLDRLPAGVRLVDLHAGRVIRSLPPLIGYLRRERPRAVIASMGHANLVALWAARLAGQGTRLVVTVHNTMSQSSREQSGWVRRIQPVLWRTFSLWAASVVTVS